MAAQQTRSKVSFSSVAERRCTCSWVAQWFNIPQAVVKTLQFIFGALVVVFMLIWNSEGLTIANLNSGELNYRNTLYGFVGIGALTCIYSVGMITAGLVGLKISAFLQSLFSVLIFVAWLVLAPVMSASVEVLTNAQYVRLNGIDILFLNVATGLGFGQLAICLVDVFLGFQSLRRIDQESKEFSREMSQSKSVMMAVRSGQSFSEAKKPPKKTNKVKPINEKSPLKDHEVQESENQ